MRLDQQILPALPSGSLIYTPQPSRCVKPPALANPHHTAPAPPTPTNRHQSLEPRAKHVLVFTILALYVAAILVISTNALLGDADE